MERKILLFSILAAAALAAMSAPAAEVSGLKIDLIDKPGYRPNEPRKRGAEYRIMCGDMNKRSMWGWRIELPDGSGLAFGGIASWTMQEVDGKLQRCDDPCVHTQVKRDGKWVSIYEELKKKNPLQQHHDAVIALRPPLKRIYARARHVYFEGLDEAAEKAWIEREIAPLASDLAQRLKAARAALAAAGTGGDAYIRGQAAIALERLDRAAPALEAVGPRTTPEKIAALRLARVALEQAAEALDAEPPPRALSMPAWDPATGLFAVFGGDHLDYLMNDLWVFDPKQERWFHRHPKAAPEPRADHFLESDGQGRLKMRGGFIYGVKGWDSLPYLHAGPDEWTYDLKADAWSGPEGAKMFQPDHRAYRTEQCMPEYFTGGERPDAAAHAKFLAAMPANTWVDLKPPRRFAGNRDWGTLAFDQERETIYFYNGGHSAYAGTDVAHYHLATNRWDQMVEVEYPLNFIGASGCSAPGWSFNRRPWITNHMWNSYGYHPVLRRLVVPARFTSPCFPRGMGNPDVNIYLYDPDYGDWETRVPNNVEMSCMGAQIRYVPGLGMIEWGRWLLDEKTLAWKKLEAKGALPGSPIDFCGFAFDPPRKRVLFFSGGYYNGTPYSGEVFAMAVPSLEVASFKPEGSEHIKATYAGKENCLGTWILREVVYHPGADMFLFSSNLPGGYTAALDVKGNRWVGLKLPGPRPYGLSSAMAYDPKRDLIYSVGTRADVSAIRLDPKTLEVKTLAEIVAAAAESGAKAKK